MHTMETYKIASGFSSTSGSETTCTEKHAHELLPYNTNVHVMHIALQLASEASWGSSDYTKYSLFLHLPHAAILQSCSCIQAHMILQEL